MKTMIHEIQVGGNTVFMGLVPQAMAYAVMSKYAKYPSDEVVLYNIADSGKKTVLSRHGKRSGFPLGDRARQRPWR